MERPAHDRGRARHRLRRRLQFVAARPRGLVGGHRRGDRVGSPLGPGVRSEVRPLRSLVSRRPAQHRLQLPRPPRRRRSGRAGGADLGQRDGGAHRDLHLRRADRPRRAVRRRAGRARGRLRRSGRDLHADGARSRGRDAGLRAAGRHPFGGLRRVRRRRTGRAHRRREAEGDCLRLLRDRTGADRAVQAAAGHGDRAVAAQARSVPDPAACPFTGRPGGRARRGSGRGRGRRTPARAGFGRGDGPALYPLHLRHDGAAEGRGARHRRARGCAVEFHADDLRRGRGRRLLDRLRCRLGGGA